MVASVSAEDFSCACGSARGRRELKKTEPLSLRVAISSVQRRLSAREEHVRKSYFLTVFFLFAANAPEDYERYRAPPSPGADSTGQGGFEAVPQAGQAFGALSAPQSAALPEGVDAAATKPAHEARGNDSAPHSAQGSGGLDATPRSAHQSRVDLVYHDPDAPTVSLNN